MCLVSTNNKEKNMGSKESVQRGLYNNLCKKTLFWDWEKLLAAVEACAAILVHHYLSLPKCVVVTVQVVSALIPENYY